MRGENYVKWPRWVQEMAATNENYVKWPRWILEIAAENPSLGRAVKDVEVTRDAAEDAGAAAKNAPDACRITYESGIEDLDTIRYSELRGRMDVAWKLVEDARRKFMMALDLAPRR